MVYFLIKKLINSGNRIYIGMIIFIIGGFIPFSAPGLAEIKILENKNYIFSLCPYFRTDVVTLKNNIDLDSKNSDDTTTYLGLDYSLGFDFKFKDNGPEAFLKLERNGPYDYDAPVFVHNTLRTSLARLEKYEDSDLLPQVEEFWLDTPLFSLPLRLKGGLFTYCVGHGLSIGTYFENYAVSLFGKGKNLKWNFYYCLPDLNNKSYLGPRIEQEKEQLIDYEHSNAHLFATDVSFAFGENTVQPYIGILYDRTDGKRYNYFSTPTHKDILGTFGLSTDLVLKELSLGLEGAHNFGKAKSSDSAYKDVEHCGYLIYTGVTYDLERFKPRSRFILASGNKVALEDVGNTSLTSGKNRAFSVYSPLNANLFDAVAPPAILGPLVAMGRGWGHNYGVNRPTTFADPALFENVILWNFGLDYQLTDKICFTLDWWFLKTKEKGVGTFNTVSKKLSSDLGNEVDFSCYYTLNDNITLSVLTGYFFPGKYYKEERDDTTGSLFTPFIRGDGETNGAYQIELSMECKF